MFSFQHHSAVPEHKARIQQHEQTPCHRPAVQCCAVQCPFCPVVCKSQDVLLDHVLVKHRNLCRGADAGGGGKHSSVSQQPLDTDTPVTDMTDMTVVGDVSRVMCQISPTVVGGGPHPPHVSSQNQSASCFVNTRNKLFNSIFPEVLRSRQVHIQSGNNAKFTSTDPSQYPYMPPLCQIDEILHYIETNHIDTASIKLDYGSYSVETITLFKTFYTGEEHSRQS